MYDLIHIATALNKPIKGILDRQYFGNTNSICDIPLIGSELQLLDLADATANQWREECDFFVANWWDGSEEFKNPSEHGEKLREARIQLLKDANVNVINLIHPSATIYGDRVKLGVGILVQAHAILFNKVIIGDYCIVDWRAIIGDGSILEENVIIGVDVTMAHAHIKNGARIGIKATIIPGHPKKRPIVTIGKNSKVFAGAICYDDVADNTMLTHNGRRLKRLGK